MLIARIMMTTTMKKKKKKKKKMTLVVSLEDDSADEESESSLGSNGGMDELRELVFQLSMAFSTAGFTDGQPGTCLLVYFSGILGFLARRSELLKRPEIQPLPPQR